MNLLILGGLIVLVYWIVAIGYVVSRDDWD